MVTHFSNQSHVDLKLWILVPFIILFLLFILPLVTCPLWGQVVQKKQLTADDYHLWGELHLDKISPDEKWASYSMSYKKGIDTLFVRKISNRKTFHITGGYNTAFLGNKIFVCQNTQGLQISNLQTGHQETIYGVQQYVFNRETEHIIYNVKSKKESTLFIRSLRNNSIKEISGISLFSLSPEGSQLVYSHIENDKNVISLINLKNSNSEKLIHVDTGSEFSDYVWQKNGLALAFPSSSKNKINRLFFYNIPTDRLSILDVESQIDFPSDTEIVYQTESLYNLSISDDSQKVFLYVKKRDVNNEAKKGADLEIWNANDKWVYPQDKYSGNFKASPKVAMWRPDLRKFDQISSEDLPLVILTGDFKYAILSNPKEYEPQFDNQGPRDYFIMDLNTFEKKLLLKKQSSMTGIVIPSPSGKYIAYFKADNWWVYDIASEKHKNITAESGGTFISKVGTLSPETFSGNPGWTTEDKEILIYDKYDVWAITPDGNTFARLTHGREKKISFRIEQSPDVKAKGYLYDGKIVESFDLERGIYLRAKGEDQKTGYFKWTRKTGEKAIVYGDKYVDELHYNFKGKNIFYRDQNFDKAPALMVSKTFGESYCLFKSNPQQEKYFWGRSELISYQNSKGKNLQGALFYPAGFDPKKKYPMIVEIYQIQADELHVYNNPTLYNENGRNTTVWTSKGYFVFLPDIDTEDENPGISAVDCVTAAVKKVLEKNIVNPEKIGLAGHSFGGYETAFIITQTSLFKTAIASGAITDINSYYHAVSGLGGKPEMHRFETEQWRMHKTPYEAPLLYDANSPISYVDKITIPLLLWSGKEDKTVNSNQSIEMYLAMRRLGRKNIMLLYPNESHLIINPVNQKDISERILQWFDYFLKDDRSVQWISDGVKQSL